MSLTIGVHVGPYEILSAIGAGGMGEVYRARDTRLDREVAIKILTPAFIGDPERIARFQREAKTLASLNHPNIGGIYGLEEADGTTALVMELVDGEDLAQRLARGAMPIDEALPIARQIAEALEAAHEQGIIHRDLKPANIKVREDGAVKVLDFGLAKAFEFTAGASANVSQSPTITTPAMTQAGMILGTAAYMSPEQAKGRAADRRSDIWAFGVVVYELLTGQRAFKGEDVSDTLAFILTREPDWTRLPPGTPPPIRKLLRRCLDKDRKRRLDSATVARLEIEETLTAPTVADAVTASAGPAPRSALARAVPWAVAALLGVVAAGSSWIAWRATRRVEHPLIRLSVDLGPDAVVGALSTTAVISPDGTRLVFLARDPDGRPQLATRLLDQTTPTLLRGTENARDWFLSPDGAWVGFFADGKLKKISVQGGAPVTLCDASANGLGGGSWGEDGNIIASLNYSAGLFRVPDAGGTPQPLTKTDKGEVVHRWPQVISGTAAVLFTASSSLMESEDANVDVFSWKTGQRTTLVRGGYFGRYLPTSPTSGHLVYVHDGTMFAVAFDPTRLQLTGAPVPVLKDIAGSPGLGAGVSFSGTPSSTGTLVYPSDKARGDPGRLRQISDQSWPLVWLDPSGKTRPLLTRPGRYDAPRLSPDGQRLALEVSTGKHHDVYLFELQRGNSTRLTFTGGEGPIWAPDGKHLAFSLGSAVWWIRADGAGEPQRLLEDTSQNELDAYSFSLDGRRLSYMSLNAETGWDIWILPIDTSDPEHPKPGKPESFLRTRSNELEPVFSPDGRWIAYRSNESGTWELYVRPSQHSPADPGGKWQVSNGAVQHPRWARDSRQLFYESVPDNHIMVADYTVQGDSFNAGAPRVWSPAQILAPSGKSNLDVTADGKRMAVFAKPESKDDGGSVHVTFLLNFFDELRRRVPGGH